jgi:hypothetical protein
LFSQPNDIEFTGEKEGAFARRNAARQNNVDVPISSKRL